MKSVQTQRITPFLWFDSQAEEAANYYVSIFPNSRIDQISRYPNAGQEYHHQPAGSVMVVAFTLDGQSFSAMNAGPHFKFTEAISMVVACKDQQELDYYWEKLGAGGDPKAQQCGWLKDKYGLSWQIGPANIGELMTSGDEAKRERAFTAMLHMHKIDIAALENA